MSLQHQIWVIVERRVRDSSSQCTYYYAALTHTCVVTGIDFYVTEEELVLKVLQDVQNIHELSPFFRKHATFVSTCMAILTRAVREGMVSFHVMFHHTIQLNSSQLKHSFHRNTKMQEMVRALRHVQENRLPCS